MPDTDTAQKWEPLLNEEDFLRAKELEILLSDAPVAFGVPYACREQWEGLPRELKEYWISRAEQLSAEPEVVISEELYLRYKTVGDRQVCDAAYSRSKERIRTFAFAECMENRGRFVSAYENAVRARCDFQTWVLTAHDTDFANFYGKDITMDLGSTVVSWELALTDFILDDKVRPEIRALIRENIQRRTFQPFEAALRGEHEPPRWIHWTNNWTAVCLGAILGAALVLIQDKSKRALYMTAWEKYNENFKRGFRADGYCSEGLSYWSYGFCHYLYPVEAIRRATGGKIDWMSDPFIQKISLFPFRMEMANGIYPCLADCKIGYTPEPGPVRYVKARLEIGRNDPTPLLIQEHPTVYEALLFWFDGFSDAPRYPVAMPDEDFASRSWFEEAGVLLCRPGSYPDCQMSVCLKGGNNREHHNHNDIGSFVVGIGDVQVLSDIGMEYYNSRTFTDHRYESAFYSSYGHSVPVIAGCLQKPEKDSEQKEKMYAARILKTSFQKDQDSYQMDLTDVYDDPRILSLWRGFTYRRMGKGSLLIEDQAVLKGAQSFETAVMTYGTCTLDGNQVCVTRKGKSVRVTFISEQKLEIKLEPLSGDIAYWNESFRGEIPVRIAARLCCPAENIQISCEITTD